LDTLRWMEPAAIGEILKTEHPQVGALILAVLAPDIAAAALAAIEDDAQADLLFRAAQLDKVNAAAIDDLEMLLKKHADHKPSAKTRKLNGRGDIAKIVNSMPRNEGERLLKSVKKRDKSLGQAIEDEMFVFDDVLALPAKTLSTILRGVEGNVLTLALKGANAAMIEKALSGMSARAAQTIQDDMAELTQIKRADVDQARKQIIAATRKLADEGSISLSGNADDYV
jgi:flagellar motor switch protein FliG